MRMLAATVVIGFGASIMQARPPGRSSGMSASGMHSSRGSSGYSYRGFGNYWRSSGVLRQGELRQGEQRRVRNRLFLPIVPGYFGFGPELYDNSFDEGPPAADDSDYYAQPAPMYQQQPPPYYMQGPTVQQAPAYDEPAPPVPPILVVLKDGKQLQVQSFAVMNGMLWDFSNPVARKIPVSAIDVDASAKATEASGGEFPSLTP